MFRKSRSADPASLMSELGPDCVKTLGITRIEHNESALFQWDDAGAKLAKVCVG
jgi:hypothetical protein